MPDEAFVMGPDMMQALSDAEPEAAEVMFLLMMREHHQTATRLGEEALAREISDVLLDQAQAMVDSQRAEQDKVATYLAEWYGVDAPEPTGDMQAAMELALDVIAGQAEAPNTAMANPGAGSPLVPLGVLTLGVSLAIGGRRLSQRRAA